MKGVRRAGYRNFTEQKLLRWVRPIVEVKTASGVKRIGAVPSPRRRGLGRGQGFAFDWSEAAFSSALFIAGAFQMMRKNKMGRWFGHAVLRAWLIGAPIPIMVVRKYLVEAFKRQHVWAKRRFRKYTRSRGDDPLNIIDRWATAHSYKTAHRRAGVSQRTWEDLSCEALASQVSRRYHDDEELIELYDRTPELVSQLMNRPSEKDMQNFFCAPASIPEQRRFFDLGHLQKLLRERRECPDHWLLKARGLYAGRVWYLAGVAEAIRAGKKISKRAKEQIEREMSLYTLLSKMSPENVLSQYLYMVAVTQHNRSTKTTQAVV